jgi:hypothetical protein
LPIVNASAAVYDRSIESRLRGVMTRGDPRERRAPPDAYVDTLVERTF